MWIRGNRKHILFVRIPWALKISLVFQRDRARVYFGVQFANGSINTKPILFSSSAIIEDIRNLQLPRPALVTYYYFDFKDVAKRNVRGLIASILLQLVDESDQCWDTLHQLYKSYRLGSDQPNDAALINCLGRMIDLPGQVPIYLVIDALDECPNTTGTPSPREKVLNFVQDLLQSHRSNIFLCITSRPKQDISATLSPFTSPSNRVSLHEEDGQRQDIDSYVRSFVQTDAQMRRWRAEDKELVINVLSERAAGM